MSVIFLPFGILTFGVALVLWHSTRKQIERFVVIASLSSEGGGKTDFTMSTDGSESQTARIPKFTYVGLIVFVIALVLLAYFGLNGYWVPFIILFIIFGIFEFIVFRNFWLSSEQKPRLGLALAGGDIENEKGEAFHSISPASQPQSVWYSGEAFLPKHVYVNDSQDIAITLRYELKQSKDIQEDFTIQDKETGKSITLLIRQDTTAEQFLEIELQAAAFVIDGEKKQKRLLNFKNPQALSYGWNCFCPNSGNHWITLAFRVVSSSGILKVGEVKQQIKVARLDHLTQRQVGIIASGTTIIGCVSTIIGIVTNFPILLHIFGLR